MDNKSAQLEFKLLADRALGALHHLGVAQRSEAIHYFVESLRVKYPDSYEQVRQKLSSNAVTNSIKKEEIDLYNVKKEEQQANSVDVTVGVASAADGVSSNSNSSAATDLNQNFEKILCKEEFMCIDDEDDIDGEEEDDIEDDDESSSSPPQHRIHRLHQIHRMDSSSSSSLLKLHEDESAAMVRMPFNAHFETLADPLDLIPSSVIDTKNPMLIGGSTKSSSDRSESFTVANISSRDIRLKRTNPLSRLGGGFTFHPESSVAVHYNQRAGEISIRSFKEQFRCRIKFALNHHHKPFLKEIYKNFILTGRIDGIKPPQRALPAPPPKPDHSLAADDLPSIGQCQNVAADAAAVVVVDDEPINGISTEQIEPTYNSTKLVLNNNNNNTNLNGISVLMSKEYNRNNNLNEFSTSGYHHHHHLHHTHPHPNLEENSQTTNTEDSSEDATNLTAVGMDTNSTAGSILNSIEGDEIDLLSLEHQHAPGHMMLQQQQFYDPHQQQMLRHQFEQNSNNPEQILMMQQQGHAAHALLDDEEPKESTSIDMGNGGSSEGQSTSAESGSKKGKPSYNCLLCPKSYRKRKSLLDHYKIHPGYCHDCGKPNGHSLEEIINHNRTVHVKEFPFVCETCGESYSRRQQFHAHVESHNKKEFKTYSCVECGQKFPHKKLHQQHLEDTGHKADGAICEVCGAEFPSKNALYQHVIRVHKKDNFFECHICQNRFTLKANLERHVQLHTEIKRTYVCDLCGSSYFTYPALKDHCSNAHTDASECKCPLCGKRFGSAKSLQRHLPSHSEERPHSCCYCEQTFKWKTHLVRHKQTMHGNQPSPKKGKRFAKCDEELIPMDIPGPPPAKMPKKSNSSKPKQQKAIVVTNTPTPMPTSTIQQSSKEQQLQPSQSQQQVPPPPPSQQQQQQQPQQQQQQQQHQQQQQQQPQQAQHHQQQQQYVSSNSNSSNNSSISHQLGGGESQNSIYNHSFNADNLLGQQCNQPTPPPQPLQQQQQQQQHHQQQQQQQLLHRLTPNADNSNLIVRLNSFNSGAETQFHFDQNAAGAYQQQQQQLINQYQQQQQQHQQHMRSHTPQSPQHQSLHHQQQLQQQQNSHFAPPHHMLHQHQLHHQQSPHQHHRQHQRSPHHHQQQQQQQQQQHQQLQQQHQQSSHSSPQQHHQQTTPLQSPQPVGVPVAVAQPQPPQQQQQQTAQSQSSHHHQQQQYPCASIQQQSANPNDWSSLNFPTPTPTANNPTNQQQQNPSIGGGGGGTGGSSLDAKDNSKFYSVIHVDPDFLGLPLNVTNPGQQQPPTAGGGGGVKQTGATPGHDQQAVLSADIMNFQNMWPQNTQPQQMAFNSATQPVVPSGQADAHNYNNIGSILTNLDIIGNNNPMEYNFELLPPPPPPQQNNSLPGPQQQHHPYANAAGLLRHTYDYPNHTLTDISEQKNTFQSYHQPVAVVTPPSGYDPQPVPGARVYGQQADETKTVLPPISEYMHHAGLQPPPQDVNLVYYPVKNE